MNLVKAVNSPKWKQKVEYTHTKIIGQHAVDIIRIKSSSMILMDLKWWREPVYGINVVDRLSLLFCPGTWPIYTFKPSSPHDGTGKPRHRIVQYSSDRHPHCQHSSGGCDASSSTKRQTTRSTINDSAGGISCCGFTPLNNQRHN